MSAAGSGRAPRWLLILGAVALASAFGLPVGSWALGLAVVLISTAALATIVGMKDAAKSFGAPILVLLAVGTGAQMIGAMTRSLLADPRVQVGLGLVGLVAVLGGVVLLLGKAVPHAPDKHASSRPSFRRRAAITDPEAEEHETPPRERAPREGGGRAAGDDDLHLFGGGRHAR